jgi:prophage maintenance system killer protein
LPAGRVAKRRGGPRFREAGYRVTQNWVGDDLGYRKRVAFVPPRPEDVASLIEGLLALAERQRHAPTALDPVVAAAALAFGIVFIHPFLDGNGRLPTEQAQYLYPALDRTVSHDLPQEVDFLLGFDRARAMLNTLADWLRSRDCVICAGPRTDGRPPDCVPDDLLQQVETFIACRLRSSRHETGQFARPRIEGRRGPAS